MNGGQRRERASAIAVIVLAFALAVLVIAYAIYAILYKSNPTGPDSLAVATVTGGIIGILGTYIGGRHACPGPPPQPPPDQGQPGSPRKEGESP